MPELRVLHQSHDLGEGGVGAHAGGADAQRAAQVDGAANHAVAGLLQDGGCAGARRGALGGLARVLRSVVHLARAHTTTHHTP
jgi:hypothetical protein